MEFVSMGNMPPTKLYKYYGNIEYVIKALQHKGVYLDNPANFNDPFDELYSPIHIGSSTYKTWCTFQEIINFILSSRDYIENHWREIDLEQTCDQIFQGNYDWIITIGDAVKEFLRVSGFNGMSEDIIIRGILAKRYSNRISMTNDLLRISCFCETNKSIPMWAYYGRNHTGICVEYDLSLLNTNIRESLQQVQYSYTRNMDVHCTKSIQWMHEQEWRIIVNGTNEEYLPFDCVTGIFLGERFCFFDDPHIKPVWHNPSTYRSKKYAFYLSLINEVKKSKHNIKLYKGDADLDNYELNFTEFYEYKGSVE